MSQPSVLGKPLDPVEVAEPDEDVLTGEILASMRRVVATRDGDGPQRRGAHMKAHCTLSARVTVPADVPEALRHGLFAQPGSYAAWIRASSAPDRSLPDRMPNVRGFAMKLLGTPPGETFVADPSACGPGLDFVFVTAPIVPFGTVRSFRDMIVATVDGRGASWFRGEEGRERAKITAGIVDGHSGLLGLTFHSSTPYRLGPHVVKYRVRAITPVTATSWHPEDALRRATREQLAEGPVVLELAVQRQRDPVAQPIEDASVAWREEDSPFEPVARVEIPSQDFDTPDRDAFGEALVFDPWHTVVTHRPLGGLNRVRAAVYSELATVRLASRGKPANGREEAAPGDDAPECLPEADPDPARRALALAARREAVQEDPAKLPPLVMCAGAPDLGRPTIGWAFTAGELSAIIALNIVGNKLAAASADGAPRLLVAAAHMEEKAQEAFAAMLGDARTALEGHLPMPSHVPRLEHLAAHVERRVSGVLTGGMGEGLQLFEESSPVYAYKAPGGLRRARSLEEHRAVFRRLPASPAQADLDADAAFARRRLVGPNAPFLRRVTTLPDAFAVRDAHLRAVTGPDDSLARATAEGRLFLCDYTGLAALDGKDASDGTRMYLYAPYLLLAVPPIVAGAPPGALRPVAIQCGPTPGPDTPVLGPADGWRWTMARHAVEVADISWFEPVTHLGHTHLLLEPAALATFRELAPNHPLARLLLPHVEGTLSVNDMAVNHLLADGGAIDQTFAATMAAIRGVAADAAIAHDLRVDSLPARIARQGLDDRAVLAEHPWRDDALRVHGAVGRWVDAYVRNAYPTEAHLLGDRELRGWAAALGRPAREGGLTGFGAIASRADLSTVVTELVFTASAGHAAVNFPQWTDASFAPRMSGAGWGPPPGAAPATEQDWLAMLPPLERSEIHAEFLYLLGALYHTRLGAYDTLGVPWFGDRVVREGLLPAFQADLRAIQAEIEAENVDPLRRSVPYTHLLPSKIPQSINV